MTLEKNPFLSRFYFHVSWPKMVRLEPTIVYSGLFHFCFWHISDSKAKGSFPVQEAPAMRVRVSGFFGGASAPVGGVAELSPFFLPAALSSFTAPFPFLDSLGTEAPAEADGFGSVVLGFASAAGFLFCPPRGGWLALGISGRSHEISGIGEA